MTPDASGTGRAEPSAILVETFESFQGEGPHTGTPCVFVRFSRCNLRCGFCDTPQSWDWTRYDPAEASERVPVAEVASWVRERGRDLVVVTGGEPLLQRSAMTALARGVAPVRVHVETNGTLLPGEELAGLVDLWVVSPKLANSGMPYAARVQPEVLAAFAELAVDGRVAFKFVVEAADDHLTRDLDEIAGLVEEYDLHPVWVMPMAVTAQRVRNGVAALRGPAAERGWQVSTRQHILDGAR